MGTNRIKKHAKMKVGARERKMKGTKKVDVQKKIKTN